VHRRAGKPERLIDVAVASHGAAEDESAVRVPGVQDAQRLVDPAGESCANSATPGTAVPGVDERQAVTVLAAAVRKHCRVVPAAEQTPDGDRVVLGASLGGQLVGLAFDKLLRMRSPGVLVRCQRSWSRRATLTPRKRQIRLPNGTGALCNEACR